MVTKVFAEPHQPHELVPRLLQALCEVLDWDVGELWRVDGDALRYEAVWHRPDLDTTALEAVSGGMVLAQGTGW